MALFGHIKEAPADPILGTTLLFQADKDPKKINLGVGAYRTELGRPFVLDVIREVEKEMQDDLVSGKLDKEYAHIDGTGELKGLTQALSFGHDSPALREGRIASVQALSGTGALRIVAEFTSKQLGRDSQEVWVSDPTWGNHPAIFAAVGLKVKTYPYWDAKRMGLDFDGMLSAIKSATPGSLILLHACAHNPTGIDPSEDQWRQIANVMKERGLVPLLDSAYQGYASGDLDRDAWSVRLFERMGFEMFLCQSFAKNLGLYGERVGMLHVVCANPDHAKAVLSQLKMVIRPMYSSPPRHGAELVIRVLGNQERFQRWQTELKAMSGQITEARNLLRKGLEAKGTPGRWNHVTDQIGMFSFTGLSERACERLMKEHHIYLLKSGRISMAGLNKHNIGYMVDCVDEVVRHTGAPSKL